jgi:hypothetical protein
VYLELQQANRQAASSTDDAVGAIVGELSSDDRTQPS